MKQGIYISLLISSTLLFSACSPSQLFSQLTQSKEEAAANETIARAERDAARHKGLEQKRLSYQSSTPLLPPPGISNLSGLVYAYMTTSAQESQFEIEGYLPKPVYGNYHVWLTNEDQSTFISIANLNAGNSDELYQLKDTIKKDYSLFPVIIISDEASQSGQPENPVLAGKLIETNRQSQ
jgi:hypothetical protein